MHRVYWNGSEWVDEVITRTPSNEETSNGFVYASNDIELFVGQSNRVERWKFDGTSWTKVEDIMTGVQTFRPVCIRNYNDELKCVFIQWTGDTTSSAKYFAWAKDGFVKGYGLDENKWQIVSSAGLECTYSILKVKGFSLICSKENFGAGRMLRAKMLMSSEANKQGAAIVVDCDGTDNNWYHMEWINDGRYRIGKMVSGSYSDLNAETVTAEIDSWFKMFLIDKGSEVEGVEGKPLLTATDTTFFLWLHRSASGTPGGVAAISWIDWIFSSQIHRARTFCEYR